jgi:SSS family solute:Na+ symporter
VVNQEFVGPRVGNRPDAERIKVRLARLLSLVIGVVIIAGSLLMGRVKGNLVEVSGKTVNVFFYPMFGLFFLALFVRFATATGAILGAIYGLAAGIVVGYWDVFTGLPKLSFQWIGATSLLAALTAGCLFSLLPTRGRSPAVAWGWSVAALALLVVLLRLVIRPA